MPEIHVSEKTFERLQALARPLVDTTDTVVARLMDYYESNNRRGDDQGRAQPIPNNGDRAQPGEFLPFDQFIQPLVEVLSAAGGELPAGEAIDAVGELIGHRFTEVDRAPVSSGEVRWRNNVRWARNELKKTGKLDPNARHGVWKLKR